MRVILFIAIFCIPLKAFSKERVYWLHSDFPPAHILNGKNKEAGYADETLKLVISKLPEYEHIKVNANYARATQELKNNDNFCHTALLKNAEREKIITFSVPTYVVFGYKLFVQPDKVSHVSPFLTSDTKVDLERLMKEADFTLGVSLGSVHGNAIDRIVEELRAKQNSQLVALSSPNHYSKLSEMAADRKRIDGFIGSALEAEYFNSIDSSKKGKLKSFYIEGLEKYELGYIGCSKSELGKKLINRINPFILKNRKSVISAFYQRWLSTKSTKEYEHIIDQVF